jgi:chromosome segregation ATPase
MEPKQIEKRVEWLDEQRRKDVDQIKSLQQTTSQLEKMLSKQEKQIKDLTGEVARIAAQSSRIRQFDDSLTKHRADFSLQLEDLAERQQERERHLEKIRKTDRDELSRAVDEVKNELSPMDSIQQDLVVRREEDIQLTRKIGDVEKELEQLKSSIEDSARSVLTIEESRKFDSKRIGELQSESPEIRKRVDAVRGVTDAIEDRVRHFETKLSELSVGENSRRESQNLWVEQQELRVVAFEKEWKKWQERFDAFQKKADRLDERLLKYDENYRSMKQTREEVDKIVERLERRIAEIIEIQRISEDRLKNDWNIFQADDQKRWNTYRLSNEEQRREHDRLNEKMIREVEELDERLSEGLITLEKLSEISNKRVIELLNTVQEWAEELEPRIKKVK